MSDRNKDELLIINLTTVGQRNACLDKYVAVSCNLFDTLNFQTDMGYDLHIVRRQDWDDYEKESNISLEEWLAYVQSDNELELTNGYQIKIPGVENSFQNVPGFCIWTEHSTTVADDKPWFDYGYGMISTKYPDDETIKKMKTIADKLNAKVQGDDGEFYDEKYFNNKNDLTIEDKRLLIDKKPWWKFW